MEEKPSHQDAEIIPDDDAGGPEAAARMKQLRLELERCETEKKDYLDGW